MDIVDIASGIGQSGAVVAFGAMAILPAAVSPGCAGAIAAGPPAA
jgi:hypothetical protein